MANSPSPTVEELQLRKRARRRLIGAVTLVAVMVTVLPMVLDDEPKPVGQDIAINIPSQQSSDFTLKVTKPPAPPTAPAPAPTPQAPLVEPEKQAVPAAPAVKVVATRQEAPPAVKEEKRQDPSDKPKESKPAPKAVEAPHAGNPYIIMLGAFLSETNAKQRQTKLKELGIKYYEEKIKSPAGEKIGVRAGPYPTRQEAENALAKLKAAGIQDGLVTEKK
jgi:DedD protein